MRSHEDQGQFYPKRYSHMHVVAGLPYSITLECGLS